MATEGFFTQTRIDYDGEKSRHRIRVAEVTAANFAAQETLRLAYVTALAGICLSSVNKYDWGNDYPVTTTPPGNPLSQRENKWLVQFTDDVTGKLYKVELGNADLSKLDVNDRKHAEIGDADVVDAFVTAFEAFALSDDGNAVTVTEITFVGRNL